MTKRVTVPKLITWESWPSVRYSVQNALLTRSTTSQRSLTWVSIRSMPYNSGTTVQEKEAELSASFFVSLDLRKIKKATTIINTRGRYFLIRALCSSNSEAVIVIVDVSNIMFVSINEIFFIDFKIN